MNDLLKTNESIVFDQKVDNFINNISSFDLYYLKKLESL